MEGRSGARRESGGGGGKGWETEEIVERGWRCGHLEVAQG
jgi:hypothetical protein